MEVLYPRCAGLDVHKDTVVAAVRLMESEGAIRREVETFATTTPGLVALSEWLERHDCPTVAMEATGSPEAVRAALTGRPGAHHRFLLGLHLGQIDALAAAVAAIDAEVERDLGPSRETVALSSPFPASLSSPPRSSPARSAST